MTNEISEVIKAWHARDPSAQVILMNHEYEPVGALYFDKIKDLLDDVVICECAADVQEKYYMYLNGVCIFFTYYKKN